MKEISIKVGDKDLRLALTAFTPIDYRSIYNRDMFADMSKMEEVVKAGTIFEDSYEMLLYIVHIMAYSADDENVSENVREWAKQYDFLDFVTAIPAVINLWSNNVETTSEAKKNNEKPSEESTPQSIS